jgi:hypothetical protein
VTACWVLVVAVALSRHEPWRDELQAWMLARDSRTLAELARNARYEGHPLLWHALLFAASRVSRSVTAMQAVHLGVGAAGTYLLARFGSFTRVQRALLAFGYFGVFEYAVVARGYVIGQTLLWAACALAAARATAGRALLLGAALVLLAQTSAHGAVVAAAFAGALVAAATLGGARGRWRPAAVAGRTAVFVALATAVSTAVAARQILPPHDAPFGVDGARATTDTALSPLARTLLGSGHVQRAYMPLPDLARWPELWGTNALERLVADRALPWRAHVVVLTAVSGALAFAALGALVKRREAAALMLWLAGTGALVLVGGWGYHGSLRHHGHLFLVLVAALWIAGVAARPPGRWFTGLLAAHAAAAIALLSADARHPFSGAPAAAAVLRARGLADLPLAGWPRAPASAVGGHLDRPVHFAGERAPQTFVRWGAPRAAATAGTPGRAPLDVALRLLAAGHPAVVLVGTRPVDPGEGGAPLALTEVGRAPGALVGDESYWLYVVRPARHPVAAGAGAGRRHWAAR